MIKYSYNSVIRIKWILKSIHRVVQSEQETKRTDLRNIRFPKRKRKVKTRAGALKSLSSN